MFNIGSPELVVILLVALIVLGPNKLPEVARQVGRAMGEIRRLSAGFQAELRDAMEDAIPSKPDTTTTVLPVETAVEPAPPPPTVVAVATLESPESPVAVEVPMDEVPTAPEVSMAEAPTTPEGRGPATDESDGEVPPA